MTQDGATDGVLWQSNESSGDGGALDKTTALCYVETVIGKGHNLQLLSDLNIAIESGRSRILYSQDIFLLKTVVHNIQTG
jgi:hypothetical protein